LGTLFFCRKKKRDWRKLGSVIISKKHKTVGKTNQIVKYTCISNKLTLNARLYVLKHVILHRLKEIVSYGRNLIQRKPSHKITWEFFVFFVLYRYKFNF